MIIKDAILQSLDDLGSLANNGQVYDHIVKNNYYKFEHGKTPKATISAQLGEFIRKNDVRVKRVKGKGKNYLYYLSKYEEELNIENFSIPIEEDNNKLLSSDITPNLSELKSYQERDLHKLLSSYLHSQGIFSKTIYHEQSKSNASSNQNNNNSSGTFNNSFKGGDQALTKDQEKLLN